METHGRKDETIHLAWVDTHGMEFKALKNRSLVSEQEAVLLFEYLAYLVQNCAVPAKDISVICAYTA